MTQDMCLTRVLYRGRNLQIKSFLRVPTIYFGNTKVGTITSYPVVLFTFEPSASQRATMTNYRTKDGMFKMNPRNQLKVTKFFRHIYEWFDSDKYRDLFIMDEHEGKLVVNMDFRNVQEKIGSTKYDAQAMLALPGVINLDSIQHEGCALAINNTAYTCPLIDEDIETILGILESFSFQTETQLLLTIGANPDLVTEQQQSRMSGQKVQW